ncbi:MAG: hypothetical protein MZV70_29200 [Desulfobacterales bacterium]|nr:hypothetical protein [Desulfobacterales bacterium]
MGDIDVSTSLVGRLKPNVPLTPTAIYTINGANYKLKRVVENVFLHSQVPLWNVVLLVRAQQMANILNFKGEIKPVNWEDVWTQCRWIVRDEILKVGPQIEALWRHAFKVGRLTPGYHRTGGVGKAFNWSASTRTSVVNLTQSHISVGFSLVFSGSLALKQHQGAQRSISKITNKTMRNRAIRYIKLGRRTWSTVSHKLVTVRRYYPPELPDNAGGGIIGSVWNQKKPYLLHYLAGSGNKPGSHDWYRHLKGSDKSGSKSGDTIPDAFADFMRSAGLEARSITNYKSAIYSGSLPVQVSASGKTGVVGSALRRAIARIRTLLNEAVEAEAMRLAKSSLEAVPGSPTARLQKAGYQSGTLYPKLAETIYAKAQKMANDALLEPFLGKKKIAAAKEPLAEHANASRLGWNMGMRQL